MLFRIVPTTGTCRTKGHLFYMDINFKNIGNVCGGWIYNVNSRLGQKNIDRTRERERERDRNVE